MTTLSFAREQRPQFFCLERRRMFALSVVDVSENISLGKLVARLRRKNICKDKRCGIVAEVFPGRAVFMSLSRGKVERVPTNWLEQACNDSPRRSRTQRTASDHRAPMACMLLRHRRGTAASCNDRDRFRASAAAMDDEYLGCNGRRGSALVNVRPRNLSGGVAW